MRLKHWFYTVPLRLRSLFRRAQVEQELNEEIRYHIERQIEEHIAKGMTEEEARYAALRAMGGLEQRKEECRDTRRVKWIEDLMQDLRYGLHTLRKSPGFTAVAALSLALGIGANTAIFSLVDPVLIKSLPVKDPEQLVVLKTVDQGKETYTRLTYSNFVQLRALTQVFSGVFVGGSTDFVDMVGPEPGNQTESAKLALVSGEYFQVLGVNAILGRTLTTADDQKPGAHPVAVLSYRFWQRRFAGDVSAIGKVITLKKHPFTIIGVTAPEFSGDQVGRATDIWAPLMMMNIVYNVGPDLSDMDGSAIQIMARLRPGVREEQAQAALDIFFGQDKSEPGDLDKRSKVVLSPGRLGFAGFRTRMSQPLRILMAAVGLVLLIACANVANLLLARAARRAPEVAIRLTIGAGRFRLIRQFLTESALLAAAGAVLGLLFAWWGHRIILALITEYDSSFTIGPIGVIPDARVLSFTIALSILTTLFFGVAPALIATRQDVNTVLKAPAPPRSRLSLSRSLVIAQVALSLLLLTGAGLFVQTLRNLRARDVGFVPEHYIQGWIFAEDAGYKEAQLPGLYSRILERLNTVPGVRSATMAGAGFLYYNNYYGENLIYPVRPGYFQAIGLPLLLGRDFTPQEVISEPEYDEKGSIIPKVAIINETMARHYFGTANPIGKSFGFGISKYPTKIVGVVKDSVYGKLRDNPQAIYYPSQGGNLLLVRAAGPAASLVATIRREIQAVDKNLEVGDIYTASQLLDQELFLERLLAKLSGFFSLLALLLACVGLYGVMSYDVARRTHEIGIRMALGAQRRDVAGLVMRETMLLVVIGIIIGLTGALATTRLITSLLYGLKPNDPLTIALASLLLLTVAALAGYLPARRAARVDPMVALRHE
ncbi:MAG: ABC transporter permease [Acidobacteria bacterium]|nr:ABC transporter permease [Acidobacteriota bacterium]